GSTNDSNPADNIPMSVFDIVAELGTAMESNTGAVAGEDFHDTVLRSITNLDKAIGQIVDAEATIGSRLNATEAQENVNADYLIQVESTLSATQDLDYAEAISRLELEQAGLQASQQSFTKIQSLSLFDFL
ncbi:MAG: flagellar hook-associated protein 3, partial [Thiotrichaceae bacterium]|nr:flagellar hook-associated protein 3 [Thiotrichaceae bacterium]